MIRLLPAAIAAIFSALCAVWAAGAALGMPTLTRDAACLLAVGYLSSLGGHWWPVITLRGIALLLLGAVVYRCWLPEPPPLLGPYASLLTPGNAGSILVLLVLAVIFLSFIAGTVVKGRRVPMTVPMVPAISIYGLAGIFSRIAGMQLSFFGFLLGSLFALAYEHYLSQRESVGAPPGPAPSVAAGIAAGYLVVLLPLSFPFSALSQRLVTGMSPQEREQLRQSLFTDNGSTHYSRFANAVALTGGVHTNGDEALFKVRTTIPAPLRGKVYDRYSDNEWSQSEQILPTALAKQRPDSSAPVHSSTTRLTPPATAPLPAGFTRNVTQRIVFLGSMPGAVYCSGTPVTVYAPRADLLMDQSGCADTRTDWQRGEAYRVTSLLPDVPVDRLRAAAGGLPPDGTGYWLQIPETAAPVRDLAVRIAGKESTPYRRAEAICAYLQRHYIYSLAAPLTPVDEDAVCFFLHDSRKGACDLFAGSMVLLCRSLGVPARLATGYLLNSDSENGEYTVYERDAHAWVEIYIPPYGWIPMDPTPGNDDLPQQRTTIATVLNFWQRVSPRALFGIVELVLLVLALGIFARLYHPQRRANPTAGFRPAPEDWNGAIQLAYHDACRRLARQGMPRQPGQTAAEYLQSLAEQKLPEETQQDMAALTALFERACYAPEAGSAAEAAQARALAAAIRQQQTVKESGT